MNAGNTGCRVQRATRSATARTPKPTGDEQRRRLGIRHQSHFAAGRGPSPAVRPAGLPPVAWRLRTRRSAAEERRFSALRRFCGEEMLGIGRFPRKSSACSSLRLQTGWLRKPPLYPAELRAHGTLTGRAERSALPGRADTAHRRAEPPSYPTWPDKPSPARAADGRTGRDGIPGRASR